MNLRNLLLLVALAALLAAGCKPPANVEESATQAIIGSGLNGKSALSVLPVARIQNTEQTIEGLAIKRLEAALIECRGDTAVRDINVLERWAHKHHLVVAKSGKVKVDKPQSGFNCGVVRQDGELMFVKLPELFEATRKLRKRKSVGAQTLFLATRGPTIDKDNAMLVTPLTRAFAESVFKSAAQTNAYGMMLLSLDKKFNPCVNKDLASGAFRCKRFHDNGQYVAKKIDAIAKSLREEIAKVRSQKSLGLQDLVAGSIHGISNSNAIYTTVPVTKTHNRGWLGWAASPITGTPRTWTTNENFYLRGEKKGNSVQWQRKGGLFEPVAFPNTNDSSAYAKTKYWEGNGRDPTFQSVDQIGGTHKLPPLPDGYSHQSSGTDTASTSTGLGN